MVRDSTTAPRRFGARATQLVVLLAAIGASGCGIKGPLKPAPSTPDRPAPAAVPAPNAPAPAQEPPPPIEPRVTPKP